MLPNVLDLGSFDWINKPGLAYTGSSSLWSKIKVQLSQEDLHCMLATFLRPLFLSCRY